MDSDTEDRDAIRADLSNMSFEDLQKLKEKIGAKLYNETVLNVPAKSSETKDFKRLNKNRPREESSKKRVHTLANVPQVKRTIIRDPRFDPLCGNFEEKTFNKNYKFIDNMKLKERELLVKELEDTDDKKRQKQIKYLIQSMDNRQRAKSRREHKNNIEIQENSTKKGEKPQFQKKSEKRIINLLDRYEELKQGKKLKKHLEKRSRLLAKKEKIKYKCNNFN